VGSPLQANPPWRENRPLFSESRIGRVRRGAKEDEEEAPAHSEKGLRGITCPDQKEPPTAVGVRVPDAGGGPPPGLGHPYRTAGKPYSERKTTKSESDGGCHEDGSPGGTRASKGATHQGKKASAKWGANGHPAPTPCRGPGGQETHPPRATCPAPADDATQAWARRRNTKGALRGESDRAPPSRPTKERDPARPNRGGKKAATSAPQTPCGVTKAGGKRRSLPETRQARGRGPMRPPTPNQLRGWQQQQAESESRTARGSPRPGGKEAEPKRPGASWSQKAKPERPPEQGGGRRRAPPQAQAGVPIAPPPKKNGEHRRKGHPPPGTRRGRGDPAGPTHRRSA
jgi:hypothetical protein